MKLNNKIGGKKEGPSEDSGEALNIKGVKIDTKIDNIFKTQNKF